MELKTARLTLLIDPAKKQAFESLCAQQDLTPPQMAFGPPLEVPPVAMPGRTKVNRRWNDA